MLASSQYFRFIMEVWTISDVYTKCIFHIIFTLIFIFQLSLISQSIFDIFLFNHDQFVMLHFDKLIQKNTNNMTTNKWSPVSIGRPLPPPLLSREETKMDMMRKSNFQLMVSCFNVWWRSFVITMVADFLHNRGETSN